MTKDMTTGNPMKLILQFTVPLLLGNLFQQMYNLIDSIIVGKALGINALASVGASSSIIFLIIGFVNGTCSGFAIPVAQCFGAKKESWMRGYIYNSAILAILLAAGLTAITCFLCNDILTWMGTPKDIMEGAYAYLIVIFIGIPFTFLYNILAGIIRALGDSRTPFLFLVISTILNIIGDLIFILCFSMGVMGAALATILAQAISGFMCLIYMRTHYPILKLTKEEKKLDIEKVKRLLNIGIPMGLQFSITAIGSIMLQTAINGLGSVYVAAYTAAIKIKILAISPYDAIANAIATFSGQNLGAKRLDRIRRGVKDSLIIAILYSILAFIVLRFFGTTLAMLFVNKENTEILLRAQQYLSAIGAFYFVLAFLNILRSTIQGLGYSAPAFFSGVFEMIARTGMAIFVIPEFGYQAACYTDVTAWITATLFLIPLFIYVMRSLEKKLET